MNRISPEEFARLAAQIPDAEPKRAPHKFRKGSRTDYELDHIPTKPLTGRQKARIIERAEIIERNTKQSGRRNGAIGRPGLEILRALVFKFGRSGRVFPSYAAIRDATGYCNEAIRGGLAALEAAGLIERIRRRASKLVSRLCAITGKLQSYVQEVQTSNLYVLKAEAPSQDVEAMAPAATGRRDFPEARSLFDNLHLMPRRSEKATASSFYTKERLWIDRWKTRTDIK